VPRLAARKKGMAGQVQVIYIKGRQFADPRLLSPEDATL
jgi:hypothetical protein